MATRPCELCRQPAPVGALACPHCGAEWPHRARPRRAAALARRRQLLLVGAAVALALLVGVVLASGDRFWGTGRTAECVRYDDAQARYDRAQGTTDPSDDRLAALAAEAARLRADCDESER